MLRNIVRFAFLSWSNYLVFIGSPNIDVEQLLKDFKRLSLPEVEIIQYVYLFICFSISGLTLFLIYFFKPFIEMYLTHYLKYNFYFLINLISLSTTFIVFRIYGYSRLYLLIYIILSTIFLNIVDRYFR